MKHLLSGVAIAAALAVAVPSWAQGPRPSGGGNIPSSPAPAAAAAPAAAPAPMAGKQRHKRMTRHRTHHRMAKSSGDAMTEQLNREELARVQGAQPAPAPAKALPFQSARPGPSH